MDKNLRKIAIIWRGDWRAPAVPTKYEARLKPVRDALRAAHFDVEPIAFTEERADDVRERLFACRGALVWVNPIADDRDRTVLDEILREAVRRGVWVSARPDVIAKMATKDVLFHTRALGWGSDTRAYSSTEEFAAAFGDSVASGARVLKPVRGNDGRGVIKVSGGPNVFETQAVGDDAPQSVSWDALVEHLGAMLKSSTLIIDQECHDASRGMVRCYMSFDRVIGFARQSPRASINSFAMNGAKAMYTADDPNFADLRDCMDKDWIPGLKRLLELEAACLPALWDADFLYRQKRNVAGSRYALCEINASCVSPFPDCAPIEIAHGVRKWVG